MTLPNLEKRIHRLDGTEDIRIFGVGRGGFKTVLWCENSAKGTEGAVAIGVGRSISGAIENLELKLKEIK